METDLLEKKMDLLLLILFIYYFCFFADDLILFAAASTDQVEVVKGYLDQFRRASDHDVSMGKTFPYFFNNVRSRLANKLSLGFVFRLTNDLGYYLGVPLHHLCVNSHIYEYLVDSIQ